MNSINYNMVNNFKYNDEESEDMEYLYLSDIENEDNNKNKDVMIGGLSETDYDNMPTGGFPPIYKFEVSQNKPKREIKSRESSIDIKNILTSVKTNTNKNKK